MSDYKDAEASTPVAHEWCASWLTTTLLGRLLFWLIMIVTVGVLAVAL